MHVTLGLPHVVDDRRHLRRIQRHEVGELVDERVPKLAGIVEERPVDTEPSCRDDRSEVRLTTAGHGGTDEHDPDFSGDVELGEQRCLGEREAEDDQQQPDSAPNVVEEILDERLHGRNACSCSYAKRGSARSGSRS